MERGTRFWGRGPVREGPGRGSWIEDAPAIEVRIGNRGLEKIAAFGKEAGIPTGTPAEAAASADTVVLAVAGRAAEEALAGAGAANLRGKVVIDATNPIADGAPVNGVIRFFTGPNESLMERLQAQLPQARFVKAFNSVGNSLMVDPELSSRPSMFICGNDESAKKTVTELLEQFGWDAEDSARPEAHAPSSRSVCSGASRLPQERPGSTPSSCFGPHPARKENLHRPHPHNHRRHRKHPEARRPRAPRKKGHGNVRLYLARSAAKAEEAARRPRRLGGRRADPRDAELLARAFRGADARLPRGSPPTTQDGTDFTASQDWPTPRRWRKRPARAASRGPSP